MNDYDLVDDVIADEVSGVSKETELTEEEMQLIGMKMPEVLDLTNFVPVKKLAKDLIAAGETLSDKQSRYIVDMYFSVQRTLASIKLQLTSAEKAGEPRQFIEWLKKTFTRFKNVLAATLHKYAERSVTGRWMLAQYGIGPVISAGILAHVDFDRMSTDKYVGPIWRYAGLDPTVEWKGRGHRRPWNGRLRVICWYAGQAFMKFAKRPECYYGQLYLKRLEYETRKNENGDYADQAREKLEQAKKHRKNTSRMDSAMKVWESGKLTEPHLKARARRHSVKLFLSHFHMVEYFTRYDEWPPEPFIVAHAKPQHNDLVYPPGFEPS